MLQKLNISKTFIFPHINNHHVRVQVYNWKQIGIMKSKDQEQQQ